MRRRLTAIALAAATLVAGATVGTTTSPASAGAEDTVRITVKVDGCPTCQLGLVQYDEADPDSYWSVPYRQVRHGKVVFEIPADRTRGTSISIDAPWATAYIHGTQFVVMQYGGFEPGDRVTRRQALNADEGGRCWSGSDRDRTLHVTVARKRYGTAPEVGLRAWANPTLPSTDMGTVFEGSIVTTHPHCPPA
ncbi:hypothetical protein [Nocardioides caricicola]|uniref:Uncharacterized protein n=1 Tax=Nocardioides caricicola TaxID=634770 RepID=A0ABW0N4L1_9ACTN